MKGSYCGPHGNSVKGPKGGGGKKGGTGKGAFSSKSVKQPPRATRKMM